MFHKVIIVTKTVVLAPMSPDHFQSHHTARLFDFVVLQHYVDPPNLEREFSILFHLQLYMNLLALLPIP